MAEKKQRVSFDLPFEIVIEIVSRLPAKSLLRFKSVCKAWYNLIETPNFIEKHKKDSRVITSILVTTLQQMYIKDEGFYKSVNLESLFLTDLDWFEVLGVCDGLVCVEFFNEHREVINYIIGNPTTRDYRLIPSPKFSIMGGDGVLFCGFCSFLNDYKLVRVIYDLTLITMEAFVKAEVYSIESDYWVEIDVRVRRVNNFEIEELESYDMMPVLQNGVFYWKGNSTSDACIVSFDISDGLYDEINIPTSIIDVEKNNWMIVEYGQEISLIVSNVHEDDRKFDVWALSANENSWSWKLRVDNIPIVARPSDNVGYTIAVAGYKGNSELLIEARSETNLKLLLYDLNSCETKILPCVDVQMAEYFYFYTESLISVKALSEDEGRTRRTMASEIENE